MVQKVFKLTFVFLSIFWPCESSESLFSWITAYPTSDGFTDWNTMFSDEISQQCSLNHVEFVARHGTRSSSDDLIRKVRTIIEKMSDPKVEKTQIGNELVKWTTDAVGGQLLVPRGVEEHHFLAEDYYNLMTLFNMEGVTTYSSSSISRAEESSNAFHEKFNSLDKEKNFIDGRNHFDDDALLFFTKCNKYEVQISCNSSAWPLYNNFPQSAIALDTLSNVNNRLFKDPSQFSLTWSK